MDTQIVRQEPPEWVVRRLTNLGGMNPFGKPNYRVIWGGNRTHLVGGMFKKPVTVKDDTIIGKEVTIVTRVAEMRTLLKYHPFRWHMERWRGPEFYGLREDWYRDSWDEEAQMHTMGDYPSEGDYEHVFFLGMCSHMKPEDTEWCMVCQAGMGEYIPLEENVYLLELQINALRLSEDVSRMDERTALFMREDQKRQVNRKRVMERVQGAMRPKLAVQPTSWQDGTRCSVPEAKMTARPAFMPKNKLGFSQSDRTMPTKKQEEIENATN